jgi:hypothetical protein
MGREFGDTTRQKETAIILESMKQVNKEHRNCADQREGQSLTIRARSPFSSIVDGDILEHPIHLREQEHR